jgi:signal transduction histidine kinase
MLIVGVMAVALFWRRSWPLAFTLVVCTFSLLLSHQLVSLDSATVIGTFVALVPTYTVGAYGSIQRGTAGLLLWMTGATALAVVTHARVGGLLGAAGAAGLAWIAGRIVRSQRLVSERLARTNAEILTEREARIEVAVTEERGRIARDLGTVVGEMLASMVVQSQSALGTFDRDDKGLPRRIALAEETGREALAKMRLILGVLRHPEMHGTHGALALAPSDSGASTAHWLLGSLSE